MSRIIFVNRYFYPDHSATSQILSDLAFALGESGRAVSVVTSRQRYDDPQARLPREEETRGVDIHRVPTTRFGRSALWGRGVDYLSFYCGAFRALLRLARPGDTLVAKTDPPLISLVAMRVARSRSVHLVNWLQDLYPEVAVELGVPFLKGPVISALSSLRDRSLKAAAANVVLEQRMAKRVLGRGVPADRIHVIPNWSDDEKILPIARHDNFLRRAWGLNDEFVVGYSGNLGRAHEFMTVLTASERLRDHPTIRFLMIGGGHQFDELRRGTEARGLAHLWRFKPYQDRDALNQSLCVPDIHWISLRPALEGLIVPSKFYGIAAAGRPVIAITAPDGDITRLVQQHDCGIVITPGDATTLADDLTSLAANPARTDEMGRRARAMLEASFTRQRACARWSDLLEQIDSGMRPLQPTTTLHSDDNTPSIASG
jgi:glycosyltransferase involved in cell wall biosynthesis